ncbi:hypothetical protein V490_02996 [Pseudogymnoascus sp. VKM F-3557]|nr:hypothetical protein V490_02996 [Pseudogymnoascus sp. VKM F-3557]
MVKKIRTQSSTDDEILKDCKNETTCGDCEPITWTAPLKGTRIDPPANTFAVVVDVHNRGAMRIFEGNGNSYIDGVTVEEAGNLVIVPWDSGWWFRASGSLRVGYIVEK